jgi:hypothetical protein
MNTTTNNQKRTPAQIWYLMHRLPLRAQQHGKLKQAMGITMKGGYQKLFNRIGAEWGNLPYDAARPFYAALSAAGGVSSLRIGQVPMPK